MAPSVDVEMSDSTRLALDRTRLAYERTLMAWVRTSVSLISFGFSIYKFFEYLRESQQAPPAGAFGPRHFGMLMITIGVLTLALATMDHRRNMQSLRERYGHVQKSQTAVLAALIALLGVVGLLVVFFGM